MLSFLVLFAIVIALLAALYLVVFFGLKYGAKALRLRPALDKLTFISGVVTVGVVVAVFYLTGNLARLQLDLGKVTEGNVVPFPTPAPVPQHEASRLFAGPHQYPPSSFAAYGIVAFPSRATPDDRDSLHNAVRGLSLPAAP
jgi:amino acid transporter